MIYRNLGQTGLNVSVVWKSGRPDNDDPGAVERQL